MTAAATVADELELHEHRRILYLTHHVPWPALSGGTLREYQLLARLGQRFVIDLIAVGRAEQASVRYPANPLGLASAVLHRDESAATTRRQRHSDRVRRGLADTQIADRFHVAHVEGGYLFHLIPSGLHERTCLVEHNIESEVLHQFWQITGDGSLLKASRRVAILEERAWQQAAKVIALTPEDWRTISWRSGRDDVRLVSNGCDHIPAGSLITAQPFAYPTALFLANFGYGPNSDALCWLLDEIWPDVLRQCPDARLILAGNGILPAQQVAAANAPNTQLRGVVEDVSVVLDEADVLLCPLRAGGGVKVKVIEALRRGCPVVTTRIGAQGIQGTVRAALHIADEAADLARAVIGLLTNQRDRVQARCRTLDAGKLLPTWDFAAQATADIWKEVAALHVRA